MNTTALHNLPKGIRAVLFDMDGVLYDSMPRHADAWMELCRRIGINAKYEDFFIHEGRTGVSILQLLTKRQFGKEVSYEEARQLYAIKSELFSAMGPAPIMPGAQEAVQAMLRAGALPVLVTGSGQLSLLEKLERDFPGAFPAERRVTALDVRHGKPDPEPFLMGLRKAGVDADEAIAVDNAPLGVESASRAGIYTIGAKTGPIPQGVLLSSGADIEIEGMPAVATFLTEVLAR